MTTSVTVLGASGSTVTIPFTSAANAAAAQNALYKISQLVKTTALEQYQYPGSGSVPAPTLFGGVVISGSDTVNTGPLPQQEYSVVSNSTAVVTTVTGGSSPVAATLPGTTVTGAFNPMTVASGTSGIVFLNVSSRADIFLGGGTNLITQGVSSAKAVIDTDGTTTVDARMGASTINAFGNSAVQVVGGGSGTAVVNAMGQNTVAMTGTAGSGTALTVNGAGATDIGFIGSAGLPALIDANGANVTVAANSGNFTLSGAGSNVLVFANHGSIVGGSGTNYMLTDTLAGATTLVGLGSSNTLIGQGAGNTYVASGATNVVADFSAGNSKGGATYDVGGGNSTVYGSVAANSTFNIGQGAATVYGQHGLDLTRGNVYTDAFAGANTITIGDFVEGHDVFSLTNSASHATLSSVTFYSDAGTSTFGAVGTEAILSDGTKIDFLNFDVSKNAFT